MRVLFAGLAVVSGQGVGNAGGIEKVQTLFEELQTKLTDEGAEAARLHEEMACTFKEASENLKTSITTNQGNHEEAEGLRQESESVFNHLNGAKTVEGSIANSKNKLSVAEAKHESLSKEKRDKGKEAMKTISQAEEGIVLVESAQAALQATTEKVSSVQSFLQLQTKLRALAINADGVEQPVAHSTSHGRILGMLEQLRADIGKHMEEVRSLWTQEENRLVGLIQEKETEISELKTKIADDTTTMEEERANVLAMDQKMHGLQLEIESDTEALRVKTEEASELKKAYDADKATRLLELQAISSSLKTLIEKFNATPNPAAPANANEDGDASPVPCVLEPVDEEVSIPTAFLQTSAKVEKTVRKVSFLQKNVPEEDMSSQEYEQALETLRDSNRNMRSPILASVVTSIRKKDPMNKIRIMIKNLIQRLKDEAQNEQNRHEYCTTEETKKQEARTSKKKAIKKYETGLEKAQQNIADARQQIAGLEADIANLKKTCSETNGQLKFDAHIHANNVEVAKHGKESLEAVMKEIGAFFSDANQAKVESDYSGDINAAQGIQGMMQGLIDDFQKTLDGSTEENARLTTEASNLETTTSNEIADKRSQERQCVENDLTPALASFKQNGSSLHQTAEEYSLLTEELIVLKYDSEACSDKQLTKEEEAANKEAEIQALKDALAIFENHGNN